MLDATGAWEKIPSPGGYGANHAILTQITPKGCDIIQKYYRAGLCATSIANRIGLTPSTLSACKKRQPEVALAFEYGKAELEDECSDLLMNMARRGNVIALIYFSKARLGWRDADQVQIGASNVTIHLPAAMSIDDLKRLRENGVTPMQLQQANPLPVEAPAAIDTDGTESK